MFGVLVLFLLNANVLERLNDSHEVMFGNKMFYFKCSVTVQVEKFYIFPSKKSVVKR